MFENALLRPPSHRPAFLLAGVACLSWALACTPMSEPPTTAPVVAQSVAETEEPSPESAPDDTASSELANTLKWRTASEIDNFGFDVFRSESEDGPFERINPEIIAGAGTIDEPQRYEYRDDTIEADTAYYYYVESIAYSGQRERFTPVFRAGPKPAPAPDDENED